MPLLHALYAVLLVGPPVLMIIGYLKGRQQGPPVRRTKYVTLPFLINSTLMYALAYNIIYFIQELFLALGKQWIGVTAYLYHNNHYWYEEHPRDDLMQGLGAAVIFVLGILLLLLFLRIRKWKSWVALFVLWVAHHGLIQSLPQLAGAPLDQGSDMGQALTYLHLPGWVEIALASLSVLAIIAVSYLFSRFFLGFGHPVQTPNHPWIRFRAIWHSVVVPALFGTVLLLPYRIPPLDRYTMTYMLLLVSIPSIFAFSWVGKAPEPKGNIAWGRVLVVPLILTVVVLLVFQLVLRPGVEFPG